MVKKEKQHIKSYIQYTLNCRKIKYVEQKTNVSYKCEPHTEFKIFLQDREIYEIDFLNIPSLGTSKNIKIQHVIDVKIKEIFYVLFSKPPSPACI